MRSRAGRLTRPVPPSPNLFGPPPNLLLESLFDRERYSG